MAVKNQKYDIKFYIDHNTSFVVEEVALGDYVLDISIKCGSAARIGNILRNGTLSITLDNSEGTFNVHEDGNIWADILQVNRILRVEIDGVVRWSGYIENFIPNLDKRKPTALLTGKQSLDQLKGNKLTQRMYQNIDMHNLVFVLLRDNKVVSTGVDTAFVLNASALDVDNLTESLPAHRETHITNTRPVRYASRDWSRDNNVLDAIGDIVDALNGFGVLKENGDLFIAEYHTYLTKAVDRVLNVDKETTGVRFFQNQSYVNSAIFDYAELEITGGGTLEEITLENLSAPEVEGETTFRTIRVGGKENEEKKYIVSNVKLIFDSDVIAVWVKDWGIDYVKIEYYALQDVASTDIIITANFVTEKPHQIIQQRNEQAIINYRRTYERNYSNALITSESLANNYLSLKLAEGGSNYNYIEQLTTVDDLMSIGDVLSIQSNEHDLVDNKHIVLGVEHNIKNDTIKSTYYLFGGEDVALFILDVSKLDDGKVLI